MGRNRAYPRLLLYFNRLICQSGGRDGQTVTEAMATFGELVEPVLRSVHRQGYRAPDIRRVYIPKPGKREKRPLGVPCVNDRALQRSIA